MRGTTKFAVLFAVLAATTCAYNPPPAPIAGDPETIGFLAGEWAGEYASEDTGRHGNIFFRLQAGADTAQGEIIMARNYEFYEEEYRSPVDFEQPAVIQAPPLVSINFVRGSGPWVYGALDEYRDPECGCMVQTTFTGRIDRDQIKGQFKTTHPGSDLVDVGTWSVRRTGPPTGHATALADAGARPDPESIDEPGLKGPSDEEMVAQGRALFQDLGCAFCHGADPRAGTAPQLSENAPHRGFSWVYRMIMNPDSMVRYDPIAKGLYEEYGYQMPSRGATPWEALVLYEYLIQEVADSTRREPR